MNFTKNEQIAIVRVMNVSIRPEIPDEPKAQQVLQTIYDYLEIDDERKEKLQQVSRDEFKRSMDIVANMSEQQKQYVCALYIMAITADGEFSENEKTFFSMSAVAMELPALNTFDFKAIIKKISADSKQRALAAEAAKKEKEIKEAEKAKKRVRDKWFHSILWSIAGILIIAQAIFWGWWTILSGIVTLLLALGVWGIKELIIEKASGPARIFHIAIWSISGVLIVLQAIALGWWAILSGIVTLALVGGIYFIKDVFFD